MPSQTFPKMDQALAQVVAKPWIEVLAELQEIADDDPINPAPHLAMAVVAGMASVTTDRQRAKGHLDHAERLLRAGGPRDVEWEFSENLFKALKSEYDLLQLRGLPEPDPEASVRAETEHRRAVAQMGRLLRRIPGSRWPNVIYAALLALSQTSAPRSRENRRGMDSLSRIFRGGGPDSDAAGFFQVYGYRRAHNYAQAIRVGHLLEQRNPRSPLVKKLLGSAHHFAQRHNEALGFYKEAIDLAPNDPTSHLGHSVILERMGELQRAKEALERAKSLDRRRELTRPIEIMERGLRARIG